MFGLGMGEIVLIAVVALLVVGPDKLPGAAKAIGKGIRDLRASTKDLTSTIEQDTQIGDAVRELRGALRGDPETLYKRATGEDFNAPAKETRESESSKASAAGDEDEEGSDASGEDAEEGSASAADEGNAADLIDEAYANTDDSWGAPATNPHEADEHAADPDLPVIKSPAGSVARSSEAHSDDNDDASDKDDSSHG